MTTQTQHSALDVQLHVLSALILRDIRTRFGRTMWGYAIAVGWPSAHVCVLFTIMTIRHMPTPLGDSLILFVASGAVPFVTFTYSARKIMEATPSAKPLMSFPQVKYLDIILARGCVEFASAFMSASLIFLIMAAIGTDVIPQDPMRAVLAFLTTLFFGISTGVLCANITTFFPPFAMGFALFTILLYAMSGVFFTPEGLPPVFYNAMLYNPMANLIMAFRSAFYSGYGADGSLFYSFSVAMIFLLSGLALARFVTQRL
ncbi:ABC transporter permease [uncultured Methylobacterium sp.]|jgi:capsular polysaccharide transport system permease protein|uniref:ABC transporter permease n=1 Tax=uncultured Methylobacterium sp. TaxID=157278 RepID=UPI0026156F9E|nr:ABC transporter permease [uncultured Methylobacterium sp.]